MTDKTDPSKQQADPNNPESGGKQDENPGFKPITTEAELASYKDGLRKSIAADVRKQFEADQSKKEADAKAEADRKEAEARGEFDTVKQSLAKERDDAKAELAAVLEKIGKYEGITTTRIDALKAELPKEVLDKFPADADPLDQLVWLEDMADLVAKLSPSNGTKSRTPETPKANGQTGTDVEKAKEQMRGRVSL